jgi:hypothetical protein
VWLFKEIEDWITLNGSLPSRVFWIDGSGGLGKSIIAGRLVDIARMQGGWLFLGGYFFCRHDDARRKSPYHVISTLAYQLSTNIPEMKQALTRLDPETLRRLSNGAYNDFEKEVFEELLAKPLREALSSWPSDRRVCILIDALDELDEGSPERAQLLSLLGRGLLSLPSQVHVIVTSRPDKDILRHLQLIEKTSVFSQIKR